MEYLIIILVAGAVIRALSPRPSSPVTVAEVRRERYQIEKDIMLLENLIRDRELEIRHFDEEFSSAIKRGDEEEAQAALPKLIKAIEEREKAYDEKDKKQIELIRAEYKVTREEALETL